MKKSGILTSILSPLYDDRKYKSDMIFDKDEFEVDKYT
jgi:hypothetical protein